MIFLTHMYELFLLAKNDLHENVNHFGVVWKCVKVTDKGAAAFPLSVIHLYEYGSTRSYETWSHQYAVLN